MSKKLKIKVLKPWIAYSSSLIQQDHGERASGHGFLLWDIKTPRDFDVNFVEIPGVNPFVTVDWKGTVAGTVASIQGCHNARFRIKSDSSIPQHSIRELISALKEQKNAVEVTFKVDQKINNDVITTDTFSILKADLHNVSVQMQLMRDYYKDVSLSASDWQKIEETLQTYNQALSPDETPRNIKWRIKEFEFDNLFGYGEGNKINFDKTKGITGIFGKNRIGKSSIVGSLLYALHNESDRGSLKNIEMVKKDKDWGGAKITVSVDGVDHIIERKTTKGFNKKKNEPFANTQLKCFQAGHEVTDIQRTDTEKVIKQLIGTGEDFQLTSLSAQGDLNKFISEGATRRRQVVSKFLDVDFFDRLHEISKKDQAATKTLLKEISQKNWEELLADITDKTTKAKDVIEQCSAELEEKRTLLEEAKKLYLEISAIKFVSPADLDKLGDSIQVVELTVTKLEREIASIQKTIVEKQAKRVELTKSLLSDTEIELLETHVKTLKFIEKERSPLPNIVSTLQTDIARKKKSIKILDDVPCGSSFPDCRFIKDSHLDKSNLPSKEAELLSVESRLVELDSQLEILRTHKAREKLSSHELNTALLSRIESEISVLESRLELREKEYADSRTKLDDLTRAYGDLENKVETNKAEQLGSAQQSVNRLALEVKNLDNRRLRAAEIRGMCEAESKKLIREKAEFEVLSQKLKIQDLVTSAYSKKGIPNLIIDRQLPAINAEIAKILYGIVGYTVEFKSSADSSDMPIYIDYDNEPRIIELASGMEKMIASLAIRVALFNVSTLPKSDIFIIDEGFGSLDDDGMEACVRLLQSLKRFFHTIIVITHVDLIKEAADDMIEITRIGKDAKVIYV